jgi:hypothetical protein
METLKRNESYINPNYINENSMMSELIFNELIDHLKDLDVKVIIPDDIISTEALLDQAENDIPQRLSLIQEKINLDLRDLPIDILFDKLLGIDSLILFKGNIHPCDITTGQATVVKNKRQKMQELSPFYSTIGIKGVPLVIKLIKPNSSIDTSLNFLQQLEEFLYIREEVLSRYEGNKVDIPKKTLSYISSAAIRL